MSKEFVQRMKDEIARAEYASTSVLSEIAQELGRNPSPELWILNGDAIQLSEGGEHGLEEAEASYIRALELDSTFAEAYESLGHFTFAVKDDARG